MIRYLLPCALLTGLLAGVMSCRKAAVEQAPTASETRLSTKAAIPQDDLDRLLADLPPETYRLTFPDLPPNPYITKKVYGSLPERVGIPAYRFKVPVFDKYRYCCWPLDFVIPNWILNTCPEFVPRYDKANFIRDWLQKIDYQRFSNLQIIDAEQGKTVIAPQPYFDALTRLQPDAIDYNVLANANPAAYRLSLTDAPQAWKYFTRSSYGTFDYAREKAGNGTYQDLLKLRNKNQRGCFEVLLMKDIYNRLQNLDKVYFANLKFEQISQNAALVY